jgi:general secretion pathway protein N
MKIVRWILLVAVLLLVVAGIAAWTCPVDFVYPLVARALGPVRLRDLGGTVWDGRAGGVEFLGRNLGTLQWRLQPGPLLQGDTVAQFTLIGDAVSGSGIVERHAGTIAFRDTKLRLPARLVAPALAIPSLELLGDVEIDVAQARLRGTLVEEATGTAYWRNAAVGGSAQARLGDLQANYAATGDGGIAGTVQDLGGPLEAAGTFKARLGQYEAQARLAARGGDPRVTEALQYVGQPQDDGSRILEIRGRQLDLSGN